MTRIVTVKSRHWKTDVYHTREDCSNKQQMSRPEEMTEAKAKELGLSECKLCTHSLPDQTGLDRRRSLRYALEANEINAEEISDSD